MNQYCVTALSIFHLKCFQNHILRSSKTRRFMKSQPPVCVLIQNGADRTVELGSAHQI